MNLFTTIVVLRWKALFSQLFDYHAFPFDFCTIAEVDILIFGNVLRKNKNKNQKKCMAIVKVHKSYTNLVNVFEHSRGINCN